MANHKSALKRARQDRIKRLRNKGYKTRSQTAVKKVIEAVEHNSPDQAVKELNTAVSIIQKTASKKIIHKNKAARKISRLTRLVNNMASS